MNKYIAILLLAFSGSAFAEAYVDGSKPFTEIKDVNRQGEAWAMCAASYKIMASVVDLKPAQSKRLKEYANGAELSIGMAQVMGIQTSEMTPERFNATWAFAKVAMEEWPKTALTTIAVEAEVLGDEGANIILEKLTATVEICMKNLEGQQVYIDTWREFYKSGLFELPEN